MWKELWCVECKFRGAQESEGEGERCRPSLRIRKLHNFPGRNSHYLRSFLADIMQEAYDLWREKGHEETGKSFKRGLSLPNVWVVCDQSTSRFIPVNAKRLKINSRHQQRDLTRSGLWCQSSMSAENCHVVCYLDMFGSFWLSCNAVLKLGDGLSALFHKSSNAIGQNLGLLSVQNFLQKVRSRWWLCV